MEKKKLVYEQENFGYLLDETTDTEGDDVVLEYERKKFQLVLNKRAKRVGYDHKNMEKL